MGATQLDILYTSKEAGMSDLQTSNFAETANIHHRQTRSEGHGSLELHSHKLNLFNAQLVVTLRLQVGEKDVNGGNHTAGTLNQSAALSLPEEAE
ncbi:hypothetical protein XELAEV_18020925mg [Xenopus laevis]|uniref:Uncharacterized protein n=1 Tax=Xenopus laevis TaxID=8355 RepID=A0A974HQW8_XENLA|nr:hypothetical protein XELAEV_18020925mg [Xenopus laevis]